jgi:hypothetical protein
MSTIAEQWYDVEWPEFLRVCVDGHGLNAGIASIIDGVVQLARHLLPRTPTAIMMDGEVSVAWGRDGRYLGLNFWSDGHDGIEWFYSYGRGRDDYRAGDGCGWIDHTEWAA